MGYYEIFQSDKNGQWYFHLKAGNHEIILASQGYVSKSGAENGVNSVMENCSDDENYDRMVAKDGSFYFNLKAGNGQVIGTSEMYTTKQMRDKGIESVKRIGGG